MRDGAGVQVLGCRVSKVLRSSGGREGCGDDESSRTGAQQGRGAVPAGRLRRPGDVPGWVMVTLMTAGLVIGLWAFAGDQLQNVFGTAMDRVLSF